SKEDLKPTKAVPQAASLKLAGDPLDKAPVAATAGAAATSAVAPAAATIAIDDFARLDLRIGRVLACDFVEGSDKLLRFELDAGELGRRQIFSGIRASYGEPQA